MDAARQPDIHSSGVPVICRSCEVRHRGVCGALTAEQLMQLNRNATRRKIESGSELFGESEKTTSYSNIIAGVVKLTKMLQDGRQQIVGLQFAPDFLGRPFSSESAMTADAATEVSLCTFPKSVVDRMIGESPELEHRLLKQALKELDEAREWMLTLGRKSATEKVASFLLLIAMHGNPENDGDRAEFELPLTRSDIADFLGLTIETVSRQLTKLRKDGTIEVRNNRHVTVPDLGALEMIAYG